MIVVSVLVHFVKWSVGLAPAETQTTDAERAALGRHAAGRRAVVEIGVWHGVTTCVLKRAMDPAGTLYAIDPYAPGRLGFSMQRVIAHREVGRVKGADVVWLETTGAAAARTTEVRTAAPDFVFIDGDHSFDGLRADWEGWTPLLATGGIVALHDSRPTPTRPIHDAGSVRYTSQHVLSDPRFESVETVDSLTVLRRR
jgi:predicted O-methyltransferase YrrM